MGYSFRWAARFFYIHHPTDRIAHTTAFDTPIVEHWLERDKGWGTCYCLWHGVYKRSPVTNQKDRSLCDGSSDRSFMVDPLSYFSFQPVLHDRCNKGCGMCYPVCWMVHIKEPLLLIRKSIPCGGSGFPVSLSVWYFTICLTPYNRK